MKWYHKVGFALLALLGLAVALVSLGKVKLPLDDMRAIVEAQASAKRLQAELGKDKASAAIKYKYRKALENLDEKERKKVERLSGNPAALTKAIIRAGRKAAKRRV